MDFAQGRHKPRLVFLGPLGTYSHQAAFERFGDAVEYHPQPTIRDAYNMLSGDVSLALLPIENSTFGPVGETLDLLAQPPKVGEAPVIRGEVELAVRHCLLVRTGTVLASIKRVLSHEQALGQCSHWLDSHLPSAVRVKTSSTAGAAEVLEAGDAAISSAVCVRTFDGLEIAQEGIQDAGDNRTRFIIVARSSADVVPGPAAAPDDNHYALLRISAGNTPLDAVLKALELNITQVVQWPPEAGTSGAKVHFVKVRQGRDMSVDRTQSVARWHRELQNAVQYRVHKVGGEGVVLGVW